MRKTIVPFFIFLFSFFFCRCDLFKPTDPDYMDSIREEIAWANAPKLTVTVDYPQEWGASPQYGTNRCFDNKRTTETPRLGYPFSLEFAPARLSR